MTNHWVDLKNANVLLIMGSNAVENHPIASRWIWTAKEKNNATIIHVDPRFTRTSAKADIYAPIRPGTDIVFLGGMIRYAIENGYINQKYVEDCTNALFKVKTTFETCRDTDHPGLFSGWSYNPAGNPKYSYDTTSWDYQYAADTTWQVSTSYAVNAIVVPITPNNRQYKCTVAGTSGGTEPVWPTTVGGTVVDNGVTWQCIVPIKKPLKAASLNDSDCVYQKLKEQYDAYTPSVVEDICGTPQALFEQICETYCGGTYADDKAGVMLYAMGWTQHTVGSQNIRTSTIVQLLLGNIGVAGGGVDALRGWHNVQGATDHGVLMQYIPGYNTLPTNIWGHANLGTGPLDSISTYLKATIPLAMDPDAPTLPDSKYWWSMFGTQYNRARYVVSNLKAWWTTVDHNDSWTYLPKRSGDCTYLSLIKAINDNVIKGLFTWGTNPAMMGPDQNYERSALEKLEWLVCCDLFETETATFWKRPGAGASNTEVFLLPGAAYFEKEGSAANSGRLSQWRDKACDPPGNAKDELEILNDLGAAIRSAYGYSGAPPTPPSPYIPQKNDPLKYLAWPVGSLITTGTLAEKVAKEVNGYALVAYISNFGSVSYAQGQQIASFFHLNSGGESACGNWLYCGTYQETVLGTKVNMMRMRDPVDYHPKQIGVYHKWGYSWPVNRRIIYNRAAVYQKDYGTGKMAGDPLNPTKWVVWWNGTNWNGGCSGSYVNDVVDGFGTSGPKATLPYIMLPEGVAHLMGIKSLTEGPFPEHYEPRETPLTANPLTGLSPGAPPTGAPLWNPCVYEYPGTSLAAAGSSKIVGTTYRLTEHWHGGGLTRNCPTQCELMPEPFVEISEELASDKGINNGDDVTVSTVRGSITVKACVTKRFKRYTINGEQIDVIGMPWHWGFAGNCQGGSGDCANKLTPYIGDVNTRIPETKVFLVTNIVKA